MPIRIVLDRIGAPEVLQAMPVAREQPGTGQAWLDHESIGVNYLDVTQRNGAVPIDLPGALGLEATGRVAVVGDGVSEVAVGDRVGYALGPLGSYSSGRLYPAERLLKLPDELSFKDASAVILKGLTAQYLIKTTYAVGRGTIVLLYGVAGALGAIIAPWAVSLGARVIGVVSRESSIERALAAGCSDALVWSEDLPRQVRELTNGHGVDVVYDGIGKRTFEASLNSLRTRGTMVSIGASSGTPDPVPIAKLNKGSLFLTRPGLAAHISDVSEYRERAADLFDAIARRVVTPSIWRTYPLAEVVAAHRALEDGSSDGAIVLDPR